MILFFVTLFIATLFLKPELFPKEDGGKVRMQIDKFLYNISGGKFTIGGGMWGEAARQDQMKGDTETLENTTANTDKCDEMFGEDFNYFEKLGGDIGGDSPEISYTNGFQAVCKAGAQSAKTQLSVDKNIEVGKVKEQMYVDLIQGACSSTVDRELTRYPDVDNIDDYVRGKKDACKAVTGETY